MSDVTIAFLTAEEAPAFGCLETTFSVFSPLDYFQVSLINSATVRPF